MLHLVKLPDAILVMQGGTPKRPCNSLASPRLVGRFQIHAVCPINVLFIVFFGLFSFKADLGNYFSQEVLLVANGWGQYTIRIISCATQNGWGRALLTLNPFI